MLTAKRFWLISLLILTLIILVRMQPIVEWADGNRKRTRVVRINVSLDEHPKEIARKLQFTTNGTYVVSYMWDYQKAEIKPKHKYGIPESITGLLEIYDLDGALMQRQLLKHPATDYADGMWTMMIHTKALKTNKPVMFKISNLKLGADDIMPPSEINFAIFKVNFIFGF